MEALRRWATRSRVSLCTLALAASAGLSLSAPALAGDGDLMPSRGKFTQSFGHQYAVANGVAIDPSGRAAVAGYVGGAGGAGADFLVARYRRDGYPARSFGRGLPGPGGRAITDLGGVDLGLDVAIDSAGRVVVAGTSGASVAVARYLPNGRLDPGFGGDGLVITSVPGLTSGLVRAAVAVDASDRVVVLRWPVLAGPGSFLVARFAPDGAPDPAFSEDGLLIDTWGPGNVEAEDVAIDVSGRIVVAGGSSRFALARYHEDGSPDPSLGGTGKVVTPIPPNFSANASAMAIGADGRIVVAGSVTFDSPDGTPDIGPHFVLGRYLDDGSLDPTFNGNGVSVVAFDDRHSAARGVAVDRYGRTVVVGEVYANPNADFATARVLPNGALDPAFGGDGTVITGGWRTGERFASAADVALTGGVRPVVVGSTHFMREPFFGGYSRSLVSIARYRGSPPPP